MASKIKYIFWALVALAAVAAQLHFISIARSSGENAQQIRVSVLREAKSFELAVQGSFTFIDETRGLILEEQEESVYSTVKATKSGISVGGIGYATKRLAIEPDRDASISINKRRFRGHVTIMAMPDLTVNVINTVELEQYIKGVLYHEISHRWPIEAIKAQAVATRSYAVYAMRQNKSRDFDVTNDIYSQVYGGKNSERFRTGIAVDATRGEVLVYKDKILPAFFHATCAGMTEDAGEIWDMDLPPLQGVVCPYCQISPHLRWKRNFRLKDIQDKLNVNGYKVGLIKDIAIVQRNAGDRIKLLKITSRTGAAVTINGKDFRNIIGPNDIRSNNYEVVMEGYYADFYGRGWGHGVGLCQWGAYGMAERRFDYKAILKHYYPGAQIVSVDELDPNL